MEVCTIWLLVGLYILSTLLIVDTSVNTCRNPNVKTTSQNSNHSAPYISSKAVDGCTKQTFDQDNCCSLTEGGHLEAWWQVDLEGLIVMEYVKIYYRDQSYQQHQRFGGYQIYQSNTSDWRNGYLCYKDTTSTSAALSLTPRINCTGTAQYLTIYSDRRSGRLSWYSTSAMLELCEVEVYGCPIGKYGDGDCDSDCGVGCGDSLCDPVTCGDSLCDPVTGTCAYCAVGYYRHGLLCIQCPSHCHDSVCNVASGVCSGCTSGYYGSHCNLTCPVTCKDNRCIQSSGECEDCEDGFYGSSCDDCSVGCANRICDKISGNCSPCLNSLYGMKCDRLCSPNCEGSTCTQYEGKCTACKPGHYGDTCSTSCPSNCERNTCNQTSGLCTECRAGLYGTPCNQSCPDNCQHTLCHRISGECEECEAGYYASQCLKSCGKRKDARCEKDTGECTSGCTDGWTGTKCDTKVILITNGDASLVAVGIGIGSGVVNLALVIVIIVLVRRRTVKRGDNADSSHITDISLSKTAKGLKKDQDDTYDEIATQIREQTIQQIPHNREQAVQQIPGNESNYEQLGLREIEIPHVYDTTNAD